jgi:microcompartment protein CcmL/EutN
VASWVDQALGLVETKGLVGAIEAADAGERVGQLVGVHVIPRPSPMLAAIETDESPGKRAADEGAPPQLPNGSWDIAALEGAKVVELRDMARRVDNFPLKGRDVARASREELLAAFRSLSR